MTAPDLDPRLREIIVCPACHGDLADGPGGADPVLVCGGCGRRYPVRDGIPVLLVDEALPADGA